jgi:DNA modification methylase
LNVETVSIAALVADPANARKHSPKNLEAIKGSLAKFGQQKPIVVGKNGVVIAGNGTMEAARSLGWSEIQIVRTDLEGPEAIAFAVADNRTGELAEWDAGVLSETLKSLQEMDFDLGAIGFDEKDLLGMIATPEPTEGLTDADEVPENVETRCKPGDLWILGKHRLLCGDSTNVQHVERLMGGEKADMVFTDPPYGVDYEGVNNDHLKADQLRTFIRDALSNVDMHLRAGACYYVFHPDIHAYEFIGAIRDLEWVQARPPVLLWIKDSLVLSRGDYHSRSEPMLYGWKSGAGHQQLEDRSQDNVWQYPKPKAAEGHPTMKPVELVARAIGNSSKKSGLVVDPFLGGGSTLIACEKTGRRCFGMELDPKYCDVILARWEAFTGQTAVLGSEGNNDRS